MARTGVTKAGIGKAKARNTTAKTEMGMIGVRLKMSQVGIRMAKVGDEYDYDSGQNS
jgi:hypothetical protein